MAASKDTVTVRNERVRRLKDELNIVLELVVHSREALQNELSSETAQKRMFIDDKFLKKLKDLTVCFNSLSQTRISLDKAERQLERDMTPGDEKAAVYEFVCSLAYDERGKFLRKMIAFHQDEAVDKPGRMPFEDVADAD